MKLEFIQTRDIKEFRNLIDSLIPDFGFVFLQSVLQWCKLAYDPYDGKNQFWELWLLKENNEVIGICGLYSLNPGLTEELWLGWLGIIPDKRNKGYGKEIMNHLYKESNKIGCKRLLSYVDKEGRPLNFYKREGFEVVGTVKEYLKNNSMKQIDGSDFEDQDDWVIKKEL